MAIALVTGQKAQAQTASAASSFPVSLPAGATAGNLVVLGVTYFGGTPAATVVTDDKGNTWAQAGIWRQSSGHGFAGIFYAANVISATTTATVHFSSNFTEVTLCVAEFSGVATSSPLDNTNGAVGSGRTPNTGTITPATANELFLFIVTPDASTTIATVTSWTNLGKEQSTSSFQEMGFDYLVNSGSTALGVSQTNLLGSSTNWACSLAAFKIAGGTDGSVTLTGAASTSSASVGTEAGDAANTISGASTTSSAGTVVAGVSASVTLVGASTSLSASVGTEAGNAANTLTGASSASSAGSTTESGNSATSLSGSSTTSSAGTTTESGASSVSLSGSGTTGSAGTTTESGSSSTTLSGSSTTSSPGTTTESGGSSISLTGVGTTGSAGSTTESGDSFTTLSGSQVTGSAGTTTEAGGGSVSILGVSVSGSAGTVTASSNGSGTVTILGVQVASQAGTLVASGDSAKAISGAASTSSAGTLSATSSASVSILGIGTTSSAGNTAESGSAANTILGISASAFAGTVTASSGVVNGNVTLTGAFSTSFAGRLSAQGSIVVPMWMYLSPSSFLSDMIGNDVYPPMYKDLAASLLNGRLASRQYQTEQKTIEGFITLWESRDADYKTIIDDNAPIPPKYTTPN